MRKKIILKKFYENREHNEKFNRGEEIYERGLNFYSDYTDEELQDFLNAKLDEIPFENLSETLPAIEKADAPESWDWTSKNVVFGIQDQRSCGCCYVRLKY
jgi:cathepsin L/cathepsin K